MLVDDTLEKETVAAPAPRSAAPRGLQRLKAVAAPRNVGAVYVWILIIGLFCLLSPDAFATAQTARSIVNQYSITALAALSLIVPLAAGYYDLSIGFTISLSGVLVAVLLNDTGLSPLVCGLLTMAACVGIGLFNALVVVGLGVDSFIATLASGAILSSLTLALSDGLAVTGRIADGYADLVQPLPGGVDLSVVYLLVVLLAIGYLMDRTQWGRQIYATGFERETARLSGVPVTRIAVLALVASSTIAGFAGLVLAARVSAGSPDAGPSYLIPAFSAAFLGATQLRAGRFNAWGAVIAVFMLGTGNVGLLITGGPRWTSDLFVGSVLITAVALSSVRGGALADLLARRKVRSRS